MFALTDGRALFEWTTPHPLSVRGESMHLRAPEPHRNIYDYKTSTFDCSASDMSMAFSTISICS